MPIELWVPASHFRTSQRRPLFSVRTCESRRNRPMDYDVVITNGTLLSAEGETQGRRRDPRRNDRGRGPRSGGAGGCRHRDHRCEGPPGHPGRRRRARPSRASLLRHGLERRLEHGHPRGGAGRRDHGDRLRHPVRPGDLARRLQQLDGPGQTQGVRRLLLPYRHHQLGSPRPRDRENGRDGLPDLQGVHDLRVGGLASRRPRDL